MKYFVCVLFLCSAFFVLTESSCNTSNVDHKNLQLNLYLDLIKYNIQEKLGIFPYIMENPAGTYLEVGTGGDPVADLLSKIPDELSPTIIASDVDEKVLMSLSERHPKLQKYLFNQNAGPKLRLQQLDATNMHCFESESIDGINASAVVHEIVSYAGGQAGLDSFFKESARVLKNEGILIYRDPESVENKLELISADFKTPSMRLFAHIFLPKFLDMKCSKLADSGKKRCAYSTGDISFYLYKRNASQPCSMTYGEYIETRSYEIDFSRQYSVRMPRGLCREIERHYLTYLHQCNPLVFVKFLPRLSSETYFVNFLAHSTSALFDSFLKKHVALLVDGCIELRVKHALDREIAHASQAIEYGIPLRFESKYKGRQLIGLLQKYGFDANRYIVSLSDGDILLDYRMLGLLYDQISTLIFDHKNGPMNVQDLVHAQYLKREGDETYVYLSDDELITRVAETTLSVDKGSVLCPLSAGHNKFIPRLCYDVVLKDALDLKDYSGYPIEINEGKRIIHFAKLSIEKAIAIWEEIVRVDPIRYQHLQFFICETLPSRGLEANGWGVYAR